MIESQDHSEIFDKIALGVNRVDNIRDYLPLEFYACVQPEEKGPIFYIEGENNPKEPFPTYSFATISCFDNSQDFTVLVDFLINYKRCAAIVCNNPLYHSLVTNTSIECRQNKEKNKAIVLIGDRVVEVYKINI